MTPVVSVDQVRRYLNSPGWTERQSAACAQLIIGRQESLSRWMRCPITPVERRETVAVLDSGLVSTSWPVHSVIEIDGVPGIDGDPPAPYSWRDEGWVCAPAPISSTGVLSLPFSLTDPIASRRMVAMHYMAGWGPRDDIVTAIIEKVGAVMLNRTDDTVVARALDAKDPPPVKEEWTDTELMMLRSRRRLRAYR